MKTQIIHLATTVPHYSTWNTGAAGPPAPTQGPGAGAGAGFLNHIYLVISIIAPRAGPAK